jgi:hypothetical protein
MAFGNICQIRMGKIKARFQEIDSEAFLIPKLQYFSSHLKYRRVGIGFIQR